MLGADIHADLINWDTPVLLHELVVAEDLLLANLLCLDLVDYLVLGGLNCLWDGLELGNELIQNGLEFFEFLVFDFKLSIKAVSDNLDLLLDGLEVLGPLLGWCNLADLLQEILKLLGVLVEEVLLVVIEGSLVRLVIL